MTEAAAAASTETTAQTTTAATTQAQTTQAATSDWRDSLPADVKTNPTMAKFTTAEGLAKSYINLEKQFGADKIVIPKDGDNDGWAKAFDALGRPADPAKYDFKTVELPAGMEYDKGLEDKFRPVAHNLGLSQKQAQGMRDWFAAQQGEAFTGATQQHAQEREAATNELKRELGAAYDGTAKAAEAALLQFAGKDVVDTMKKNGLINDPFMIKVFGKIGRETLGEDKLKASGAITDDAPEQLKAKITEFRSKHSAALYDKNHVEHAIRVQELTALTTRLHGDAPVHA